jgi:hypothetical protein
MNWVNPKRNEIPLEFKREVCFTDLMCPADGEVRFLSIRISNDRYIKMRNLKVH